MKEILPNTISMKRSQEDPNALFPQGREEIVSTLDALLGSSDDVVIKYDLAQKIIYINEAFSKYTGQDRKVFIGKPFTELEEKLGLIARWRQGFSKAAVSRKSQIIHSQYLSPFLGLCSFETRVTPQFNSSGEFNGYLAVARDITHQMADRNRLKRSSNHWELMVQLSKNFIITTPENALQTVNEALAGIGHLLDADRAFLFKYDLENGYVSNTHEWCAQEIDPAMDRLQNFPIALIPDWIERHSAGLPLIISDVRSLQPKSAVRETLELQGIKSMAACPILLDGKCWGFVGIDFVKAHHDIKQEEVELLELFAGLVSNLNAKLVHMEELRLSEMRFKLMVEKAFAGIYVLRKGKFEFVNQLFCRLTGYSEAALKHQDFELSELITSTGAHALKSIKEQRAGDLSPKSYNVEIKCKDGRIKILTVNTSGITDDKGVYTLGIAFDMSKTNETQQAIEGINKSLTERNKSLKEFAQLASHNLRSPIANIIALVGHIDKQNSFYDGHKMIIDGIEACTQSMDETLNDMLQVIRTDDREREFEQEIELESVLAKVKQMIHQQVSKSDIEIHCDFKSNRFHYNIGHIENFILNMLTNAIRYRSPERRLKVEIKSVEQEVGTVLLSFKDNGLGIDLEKYGHKIFKLYQRFHNHPESRGMGLYLMKTQLEKYGGEIEVESAPDKGSTFHIRLQPLL
jgi:PAS domain S-box-containing protein